MHFQKYSYPVLNPKDNKLQIMKDRECYVLDSKRLDFLDKVEECIEKGILDWEDISNQTYFTEKMSERFMRKHVDDLNWWSVLHSVDLSESFLREIIDYLDWNWVLMNKKFYDKNMMREFKDRAVYKAQDGAKFDLEDLFSRLVYSIDE